MKLKRLFTILYISIIVLLIALSVCVVIMYQTKNKLIQSNARHFKSYSLALELQRSSDNLTRFCRTYVITRDSIWEKKYWNVLDVRNGIIPGSDGRTISLKNRLKELGFTQKELNKLKEAEDNSNSLVWTEKVAFNAMKGLFADKNNQFTIKSSPDTILARSIMFDDTYHTYKESISTPIKEFNKIVRHRTENKVNKYIKYNRALLYVIILLTFIILTFSIISYLIVKNKIIKHLEELGLAKNIAEKRKNQLIKINKTKEKFYSIIAHDLRSPFVEIMSSSRILIKKIDEIDTQKAKNYANAIHSSASNSLNLLDNLLNWSMSQTDQISFNPKKINLSTVIDSIISRANSSSKLKNISLKHHVHKDIYVYADIEMLKTVFRNLISNAIKFTNKSGQIEVYTNKIDDKIDDKIEVTVSDNGVGIDKITKEKIFQIESNKVHQGTENEKGSGLGLILCKEFIEKHKGIIWVESEVGKGSQFKFTLPINKFE